MICLKKILKRTSVLPLLVFVALSVGLSSCGGDDNKESEPDPGPRPATAVTVSNSSVITLKRFRVVFLNALNEILTDKDFGTLAPGEAISASIPQGATQYYMATYLEGDWYFSANYQISFTSMNLTDAVVNEWKTNASARGSSGGSSDRETE